MKILCFPKYRFGYPLRVESSPATLYCGSVRSYYGLWIPPSVPSLNRRFEHQFSNQSLALFPSHVCWYIVLKCRQCYKHLTYRHTLHSNARRASMFFSRFLERMKWMLFVFSRERAKNEGGGLFPWDPSWLPLAASLLYLFFYSTFAVYNYDVCVTTTTLENVYSACEEFYAMFSEVRRYEGRRLTDSRAPPLLTSEDIKV